MATISSNQPKITPCLWFDMNAEEAVKFYLSVFSKAKKLKVSKYAEGGPAPKGTVLTIQFQIEGQEFLALNGGPNFKFNESVSFVVNCKNQKDIDYYWEALSKGGEKSMCGWLKDKFGLSWQIAPANIGAMLTDKDPKKSTRVFQAIMGMQKIDMDKLKKAYAGK